MNLPPVFAGASFSTGSDSPWPLVVFVGGMVLLGLAWMWMQGRR